MEIYDKKKQVKNSVGKKIKFPDKIFLHYVMFSDLRYWNLVYTHLRVSEKYIHVLLCVQLKMAHKKWLRIFLTADCNSQMALMESFVATVSLLFLVVGMVVPAPSCIK